jgi:hypothetical protein
MTAHESVLGGACLVVDGATATRESLMASGLTPQAADDLLAFGRHLARECDASTCRFSHKARA